MRKSSVWKKIGKMIPVVAVTLGMSAGTVFAAESPQVNWNKKSLEKNMLVDVQLLGINDFHGQLDVTRKVGGQDVGRADYLAAYLEPEGAKSEKYSSCTCR